VPLRIALVTPRFSPYIGGLETHVACLAGELARRGHAIEVFTQRSERTYSKHEWIGGIEVRRCNGLCGRSPYPVPVGLRRAIRNRGRAVDVVHAHGYHALAALGAMGVRRRDVPLIFTPHYHGTGHTTPARVGHVVYRPLGRHLFRQALRVICVSASEAALVRCDFGSDVASRTVVIPSGVNDAALRQAEPYEQRDNVVLCVGRLVEYKNVGLLIGAARTLPESAHVVIVGKGPDRARLEGLAARYAVTDRVTFLGAVSEEELRRWYRSAAVAVAMSRHEAFGTAFLEALVGGSQVVASSIPAHRDMLELVGASHVNLLPLDVKASELSARIGDALREGRPASRTLETIPTWSWVAEQTERVYEDAVRSLRASRYEF
jgi:glycosyltransferase involved in cell wall biosynthesis